MNTAKLQAPRPLILLVLLLLLAFGLRVRALDARPLWWDEGLTLTFSRLPPAANAAFSVKTLETNPPVYRWSVGALTALIGTNVFTSRLVGVYAGVVTAAAVFAVTRRVFNWQAAIWTLLLFAVSPLQVYYAQEAKGYTFEAAAVLIGALLWYRMHLWAIRQQPDRVEIAPWSVWVGFALTIPLALGANYFAIFAIIVENIFTLFLTVRAGQAGVSRRSLIGHWGRWLTTQLVGALMILPFVIVTFNTSFTGLNNLTNFQSGYGPLAYLWRFLGAFTIGELSDNIFAIGLALALLLLAMLGFLSRRRTSNNSGGWFTLLWLAIPLALGFFMQLKYTWFFPRFLLYAQPALLALAGAGLAVLAVFTARRLPNASRLIQVVAVIMIIVLFLPLLQLTYNAPPRFEEDVAWPEMFTSMQSYLSEGDVVITRMPWQPGYMYAYLPADQVPNWILGFFDEQKIDEQLSSVMERYDRIWEIDYGVDPFQPPVDTVRWMQGRAALAHSGEFSPATLSLFIDARVLDDQQADSTIVKGFQNGVHVRWNPVIRELSPGDILGLNLTWWTEELLDTRMVRFLHLIDTQGQLVAQVDKEPVMGYSFSDEWNIGDQIQDPVAMLLPLNLPPGEYELWLGLYDRNTIDRVPLSQGADHLVVGKVIIQ